MIGVCFNLEVSFSFSWNWPVRCVGRAKLANFMKKKKNFRMRYDCMKLTSTFWRFFSLLFSPGCKLPIRTFYAQWAIAKGECTIDSSFHGHATRLSSSTFTLILEILFKYIYTMEWTHYVLLDGWFSLKTDSICTRYWEMRRGKKNGI